MHVEKIQVQILLSVSGVVTGESFLCDNLLLGFMLNFMSREAEEEGQYINVSH